MTLLHLFFVFFYIGLFAIGGGLVAVTFMEQALVDQYHLITAEKFYSMLAISESTPGPIGINLATYIGTELFGPVGGIVTTFGEVLPSLIVIILIARFFSKFKSRPTALEVIRPVTTGMVLVALANVFVIALINRDVLAQISFDKIKLLFNWPAMFLYSVCLAILFRTKLHPVVIVLLGAVFGVLFM